jgi:cytochrome c oxidase subunit IV
MGFWQVPLAMTQHEDHHGVGHVVSPKVLIATCAALLVLTVITVLVAKIDFTEYNLYELNIVVALAVAVTKASLVCLFFMHLYWDRPFNSFVLIASLAFVALFMGFAMIDVSEYHDTLVSGDAEKIVQRLDEAAKALPASGSAANPH